MKLNITHNFGWETLLMFSLWGGALRVLPISKNIVWLIIFAALGFSLILMSLKVISHGIKLPNRTASFFFFMFIFFTWCLTTLMWSPIESDLLEIGDISMLITVVIPTLAIALGASINPNFSKHWVMGVIIVSFLIFMFILPLKLTSSESIWMVLLEFDQDDMGGNYLLTGYALSSLCIICFIRAYHSKKMRLLYLGISAIAFWLTLDLGGRAPVLASAISIIVFTVFQLRNRFTIAPFIFLFSILMIPIVYGGVFLYQNMDLLAETIPFFLRFQADLVRDDLSELTSIGQRIIWIDISRELIAQNPIFGNGLLSWRQVGGLAYDETYPHNIVLDILCDLGVIGLILFLPIILMTLQAAKSLLQYSDNIFDKLLATLFIYFLLLTLTSGYIYWDWIWVWMTAVIIARSHHEKNMLKNNN